MIARRLFLAGLAALLSAASPAPPRAPLVLAAASLQESMTAAASAWAAKGHARPVCSFAASSALARQIAAGAAADLFVSADEPWMDDVEKRGLIVPGTRAAFLGNRLVVVRPKGARGCRAAGAARPVAEWWAAGAGRSRGGARGEICQGLVAEAGGVGRGGASRWCAAKACARRWRSSSAGQRRSGSSTQRMRRPRTGSKWCGCVPDDSHPPIRYPLARLKAATSPDAEPFRRYLLSGEGRAIFRRFGFLPL
jgi:molybdate transport system substrate-binding protein